MLEWRSATKNLKKGDAKTPNVALTCVVRETTGTLWGKILSNRVKHDQACEFRPHLWSPIGKVGEICLGGTGVVLFSKAKVN